MSKRICILTLVTLCSAVPASAQYRNFGVQCTPGAFQACASVELWNETDTFGQLYLYVRMANVQGTTDFTHLQRAGLGSWSIDNLTLANYTPFYDPWGSDISSRSEYFSDFGVLEGNTYACQFGTCAPETGPRVGEFVRAEQQVDGDFRIMNDLRSDRWYLLFGCDAPQASDGLMGAWGTCEGGTATWATNLGAGAAFQLTDATEVSLSFEVFGEGGQTVTTSCTTGADCTTVTPEPVTLLLMGSGLAGIAGARARRRRQSEKA